MHKLALICACACISVSKTYSSKSSRYFVADSLIASLWRRQHSTHIVNNDVLSTIERKFSIFNTFQLGT